MGEDGRSLVLLLTLGCAAQDGRADEDARESCLMRKAGYSAARGDRDRVHRKSNAPQHGEECRRVAGRDSADQQLLRACPNAATAHRFRTGQLNCETVGLDLASTITSGARPSQLNIKTQVAHGRRSFPIRPARSVESALRPD